MDEFPSVKAWSEHHDSDQGEQGEDFFRSLVEPDDQNAESSKV